MQPFRSCDSVPALDWCNLVEGPTTYHRASRAGALQTVNRGRSTDLEFRVIADAEASRLHHRLAHAQDEPPAAARHDVRGELRAADTAADALLLEPAEGLDLRF